MTRTQARRQHYLQAASSLLAVLLLGGEAVNHRPTVRTFERRVLVQHLDDEHLPRLAEELLVGALPPPQVRHQEHHLPFDEEPQRLYQGVNQRLVVHHIGCHDEVQQGRRRQLLHRGDVAPGERHEGGGAARRGEEGCVELGVVEEVGKRVGEVGEDATRWEGRGQGEARGASAGAELEETERATRGGGGAREDARAVLKELDERGGGGPELEREAPRGERADGDGERQGGDVEVVELLVQRGGGCVVGDEEVRKKEEEVLGVGVRGDGGRQCAGDHGGGGHRRRSWERVGAAVTLYRHVGFAILTQADQDHALSMLSTEKGHFLIRKFYLRFL
jgi:hypothetical protein